MVISTKIERIDGKELVRVRSINEASPTTNKDLIRPLHYHMLIGTHVPDEYQMQAGALVVLLFNDPKVVDVEIWYCANWIADALVETARGHRLRRGEGETPVEAFNRLILDIQRY